MFNRLPRENNTDYEVPASASGDSCACAETHNRYDNREPGTLMTLFLNTDRRYTSWAGVSDYQAPRSPSHQQGDDDEVSETKQQQILDSGDGDSSAPYGSSSSGTETKVYPL